MHRLSMLCLCPALLSAAAAEAPLRPLPIPAGTTATASCACEPGKGPELLIDGDPGTAMNPVGGSGLSGRPVTVDLRFPQALAKVAGIRLGPTDPFQNYYPIDIEVWVDSDGNGSCETMAVAKGGLTPLKQALEIAFDKPVAAKRLELRIVKCSQGGGGRAPIIAELALLTTR